MAEYANGGMLAAGWHEYTAVDEEHVFSQTEWAAFSEWLKRGGSHAHPDMDVAVRGWEAETAQKERTVSALSAVFAVAQGDPRFRLEAH